MATEDFYNRLHDEFRGSANEISKRLQQYLPFLDLLDEHTDQLIAIDYGSGRGEWLKILQKRGIEALGVDSDLGMFQFCTENGIQVINEEALTHIRGLTDNSVDLITGFHIIEHLKFEDYLDFITQSFRVLGENGILILETPNPNSPIVGMSGFWLDPTHVKPLPPKLLDFVCRFAGFQETITLLLQHSKTILEDPRLSLFQVFVASSPDYSIIARKTISSPKSKSLQSLNIVGVEMQNLANQYDKIQLQRMIEIHARLENLEVGFSRIVRSKAWQMYIVFSKIFQKFMYR